MEWTVLWHKMPPIDKKISENVYFSEIMLVTTIEEKVVIGNFCKQDRVITFYALLDSRFFTLNEITHWMLLPEPAQTLTDDFYIKDGILIEYLGREKCVMIPTTVTSIAEDAFSGCDTITEIYIPNTVTNIGDAAFFNCSSLTKINIPNSVTHIGESAFAGCSQLTKIALPDFLTNISAYTFEDCGALTNIVIPNSVTEIGIGAFRRCISISNIFLPDSLTDIEYAAFSGCSALANISIPASVEYIGKESFMFCKSLQSVSINGQVSIIDDGTFSNCSSLKNITIPSSVTAIEDFAFYDCSSLSCISIPHSVIRIGEFAFAKCTSLTTIAIPDSVASIGKHAFQECLLLKKADLPQSIKIKGEGIFEGCINLNQYVFFSYKSEEKDYAYAIKSAFESNDINVWIAPDSIPNGSEYAVAIKNGIKNSSCLLLVLSRRAQSSRHVLSEVRIAFDEGKPIVCAHIDDSHLSPVFEYYLGNDHITQLKTAEQDDQNLIKIINDIKSFLQ